MNPSSHLMIAPGSRLVIAVLLVLAGGFGLFVAVDVLALVANVVVVAAGLLMVLESQHQLRARRVGAPASS